MIHTQVPKLFTMNSLMQKEINTEIGASLINCCV
jgi:hypothetical protein